MVETLGDEDRVPTFDRRVLGGATNLRRWDYREVGPRDANNEPLGGGTSAYLTAEYNFPIVRKVRGVVFADAGFQALVIRVTGSTGQVVNWVATVRSVEVIN